MNITIRRAGVIFVIVLLLICGVYYYSLPSRDSFLRDTRWISNKSAINLATEMQLSPLYVSETDTLRVSIPTDFSMISSATAIPFESKADYVDTIEEYRSLVDYDKVDPEVANAYFDEVIDLYYDDELQYTAGMSIIDLELKVEVLRKISPNIPAVVDSSYIEEKRIYAIFRYDSGRWRLTFFVEEEDGKLLIPDIALEKFFGYEPEETEL